MRPGPREKGGAPAPPGPRRPPRKKSAPMSGTPYPPTDCTAVLSARGGLTAEFGMGSGDPPLSMVPLMQGARPARFICFFQGRRPWGLHGAPANLVLLIPDEDGEEELGLLVPLA